MSREFWIAVSTASRAFLTICLWLLVIYIVIKMTVALISGIKVVLEIP